MARAFWKIISLVSLFTLGFSARAQPLEEKVVPYTLQNGMRFLLVQRPGTGLFAGYVRVKVGGADEKKGKTGIAHLLEHMAFKGSKTVGTRNYPEEKKWLEEIEKVGLKLSELHRNQQSKTEEAELLRAKLRELQAQAGQYVVKDEFSRILNRKGASEFNATTSKDLTSYFLVLPSQEIEAWANLQADQFKNPVFREFYSERDVVLEERRMRIENSPFGKNYEALLGAAFVANPYKHPTIGYVSDLESLTATDLYEFYKTYYVPQNMVGAIVGDFDLEKTKRILEASFGTLEAGPIPPSPSFEEPSQTTERNISVTYPARPQVLVAFHKPTFPNPDDEVFDLILQMLCEGRTSRFHQSLVEKKQIAQSVDCDSSTPGSRLDNLFLIYGTAIGKHSPEEILTAIQAELDLLATKPISTEELERARKQILSTRLFEMQSNLGLAETLSYFESTVGNWRYAFDREKRLKEITPEKIREVASRYFKKTNRTASILSEQPRLPTSQPATK